MGGMGLCSTHGGQSYVSTSPGIADAVCERGPGLNKGSIVRLTVRSDYGTKTHVVDTAFCHQHGLTPVNGEVLLQDRCTAEKRLYDRVVWVRVKTAMTCICPLCLEAFSRR